MKVVGSLLTPVEWGLNRLAVAAAPQRNLQGFVLACVTVGGDCETFFTKCSEALALMRTVAPRRFHRMQRDVRIVGLSSRGASYYERLLKAIFLDVDVLKSDVPAIAATIVHEATHARLHRSRVRAYSAERDRHERICIAAEIDFASRLPDSADLVARLRRSAENPWWNEAGRRAQITRVVERHHLPSWLERLLVRFGAGLR